MARWLDDVTPGDAAAPARAAVAAQLPLVPQVARAVVDMSVDGVPLREVCGWAADTFAAGGPVSRWTQALRAPTPVVAGRSDPAAARHGVAAGVEVYRTLVCSVSTSTEDPLRPLRENLPALRATCGPPGTLAAKAPPDLAAVADRPTERLLTVDADGIDRPGRPLCAWPSVGSCR